MQVRISQRFKAMRNGVDLVSAGEQLAQHAQTASNLDLVGQKITDGGRLVQVYEGAATAEPDAGHHALSNRSEAEALSLQIDGESITVVEFPGGRKAAWVPSDD